MPSTTLRRPVPALIALAALLLLTALVWWRVLHRDTGASGTSTTCPTTAPSGATLPAPSTVTVKVLNATDRTGIGARTRNRLIADGFRVPDAATNDRPKAKVRGVAEIRFGTRGHDGAALLRYYFPGAHVVSIHAKTATVTVSLGDKFRGVATASSVQAALKRKDITLDTTTPGQPTPSPSC